jgi:class 3 adenylate cyclase/tetratricopeptide (TPR) repeat protein
MAAADPVAGAPPDPARIIPYVPRLTIEWLRDEPDRLWRSLEGTLVFVDISGFTAMSERLVRFGKVGAEEITEVMNRVFAALLEDAYRYGGGLLKFGGDALLLLYDGSGHCARASRAAHQMRRTLRALGRPQTSGGAVTLRMHVGIHSGELHFFLVGDSHRELLVAGPGASRTVQMEDASGAGDILLSAEAAAFLDPRALGEPKGEGILLKAAPQADERLEPLPDVSSIALEEAVPLRVRRELVLGPVEGEHRHAAIGFVRFTGTDVLLAEQGGDATAEALDGLVRIVQRAADDHGVTFLESDIDRNGGRIILVSGTPQTEGDDEERLLRTLRAVADADPPLTVHAGASQGRVFAGPAGASFRRTYTVLGDTAALAARLMTRAGENEILVSADVLERVGPRFETTELDPFRVKGKSAAVRASILGGLVAAPRPRPAQKLPFVDRERERAVLAASVAPVRSGFGTLVELIGEPGIGKSRLADELCELFSDMRTHTVSCDQYASSSPYHPFRGFLRTLLGVEVNGDPGANLQALSARLGELDRELAPWAPLLGAPLDVEVESSREVDELDPAFRRARLHGVVAAALGRLLDSPTLMLVEDVHWMDDASSELLRHIGTQLPTRPWLVCTTRRPVAGGFVAAEGTPPLPAFTIRLEPLPDADAEALIKAAAGDRALGEDEFAAIAERAAGNPLFLQELASPDETAFEAEELPENVESLVATQIDRLAPADRTLLRWASVLGTSFAGSLIAAVLEGDPAVAADSEAWDRLAEFVERHPEAPGAFRFRHALIRDAAYEGLSYRRRRELHARVAEVLEEQSGGRAEDVAELLSLHFHRTGRTDKAWHYSVLAGRRAQEKWANVEAAELYRRALDVSATCPELTPEEIAAVWEALGDCLQLAGELGEAGRAFATARRLHPTDAPAHVALLRKEGVLREAMGKYPDALRWYGRALKAAEAFEDDAVREGHVRRLKLDYAEVRFRQGVFRECIRRCDELVAEALEAQDVAVLAATYRLLHTVHTFLGSPERTAFRGLALPLYEELGDLKGQAITLNNMGIEAYYEGDWEKALDLYEHSRALFRRVGDVTSVAMATNNIGEIRSDQGRIEEAEDLFEEAVRTTDAAGQRPLSAVANANLARAAARAGRLGEAEEKLARALEVFRELNVGGYALEAEARLAEVDALRGDRARQVVDRAQSVLERTEEAAEMAALRATALRLRAVGRSQLGDNEGTLRDLDESIRIARKADAHYELALALDLKTRLGGHQVAGAESTRLLERLGVERVARPPLGESAA